MTEPPSSELLIQATWSRVLGLTSIDLDDDVRQYGADSLDSLTVFEMLEEHAGRELPIADMLACRTAREMSACYEAATSD